MDEIWIETGNMELFQDSFLKLTGLTVGLSLGKTIRKVGSPKNSRIHYTSPDSCKMLMEKLFGAIQNHLRMYGKEQFFLEPF